jgi:uncharacterized membrane protein YraQ (UPF0718 family)
MLFIRLQEWLTRFTAIMVTAFPLLVLGVLAYAIIERTVTQERIVRLLPRQRWLAIPFAALLGIILPVCDCGVVPTARALIRRELGLAPALAFLIGAPVINPIVFFTTAAGFGFNYAIAWARLALTFVVAVGVGVLALFAFGDAKIDELVTAELPHLHDLHVELASYQPMRAKGKSRAKYQHAKRAPLPPWLTAIMPIIADAGEQLLDLGRFLVVGALIAAAVQTFVPQAPLLTIGHGIVTSTLALMLLASILSLCSISDAPVAFSFLGTFAPGAVFAFMMFGQIIDMKNGAMLLATFRRNVVIFFVIASGLLVLALGALVNLGVF